MLTGTSEVLSHIPTASFSQEAEKALVSRILEEPYWIPLQKELATYVYANEQEKNEIIITIMKHVWKDGDLFEAFKDFDVLLSIAGKRGHFIHQFEVFILGLNFIFFLKDKDKDLRKIFGFSEINEVIYCWLLASASHDFGYPIEKADLIVSSLASLYDSFSMEEIGSLYRKIEIKEIVQSNEKFSKLFFGRDENTEDPNSVDIGNFIFSAIKSSLSGKHSEVRSLQEHLIKKDDHGYASAVLLCRKFIEKISKEEGSFQKAQESWKMLALKKSMGAVALHNLKPDSDFNNSFITEICFDKNPFAYMLFLFDNIQDWGRILKKDRRHVEYHLQKFTSFGQNLSLNYLVSHDQWTEELERETEEEVNKRRATINLPKRPKNKLGITFDINFSLNKGGKPMGIDVDL